MREAEDADFVAYATEAAPQLQRLGFLICGDWQRSEDAVQDTLLKLYRAWGRIRSRAALDVYARRTLTRQLVDESRRPWRRERASGQLPDRTDEGPDRELAWSVRAALANLPPRQRAVLALRYYEGMDVKDTAEILTISEGTVKSQAARGLGNLRRLLGDAIDASRGGDEGDGDSGTPACGS